MVHLSGKSEVNVVTRLGLSFKRTGRKSAFYKHLAVVNLGSGQATLLFLILSGELEWLITMRQYTRVATFPAPSSLPSSSQYWVLTWPERPVGLTAVLGWSCRHWPGNVVNVLHCCSATLCHCRPRLIYTLSILEQHANHAAAQPAKNWARHISPQTCNPSPHMATVPIPCTGTSRWNTQSISECVGDVSPAHLLEPFFSIHHHCRLEGCPH